MKAADRPTFIVDRDFKIAVDAMQWIVYQRREIQKGTRKGEVDWDDVGFCRDLPACLRRILTIKSEAKIDLTHVTDLLAWQSSIMHTMLDRVLRKEKALKEAIEVNKVMVSTHSLTPVNGS